ncbi:MAG: MBL fold metallo-hydrolase [Firmicutes bacterium]|nr:MBL fold metallo-hydrolase [Bacillota bacterium]
MRIKIHRGAHEIGGSCVELQSGDTRIVVDLGLPLVKKGDARFDSGKLHLQTGVELVSRGVLPDIKGLYTWDTECRRIDALFLSHAHMDHYGLVNFVSPDVPVFSGEATRRLMDIAMLFCPFERAGGKQFTFANRVPVQVGGFRITPFLVDHSAFDAYAFLIEAQGKSVFYSGDFREHGRKTSTLQALIRALSGKPVDVMLLEGTTFGRPEEKIVTEKDLEDSLIKVIGSGNGICLACSAGQNIDRLVTFYRAALRCEKIFVIDVYTAIVLDALRDFARLPCPSEQYSKLRVFFPYWLCKRLGDLGHTDMLYRFKRFKISRREVSEQQNRLLMLVRPSMVSDLKKINFSGGNFIYSMWLGYQNEPDMACLLNFVRERDMKYHYVHTSGHATLQTLKKLVEALRPREVIPFHITLKNTSC